MKVLGIGRMATVYYLNEQQVLKLFNKDVPERIVMNEFNRVQHINTLGLSSPKAYSVVKQDGCFGIVYEVIKGSTMLNLILDNKLNCTTAGQKMAMLHLNIHKARSTELSSLKDEIIKSVNSMNINGQAKSAIIAFTKNLPDDNNVCHLDFHPDNLLKHEDKTTVLDWANCVKGCKAADVYYTILSISTGALPPYLPAEVANKIITTRRVLVEEYLKYYLAHSDLTEEEIYKWELPMLAYRYINGAPEEQESILQKIGEILKAKRL